MSVNDILRTFVKPPYRMKWSSFSWQYFDDRSAKINRHKIFEEILPLGLFFMWNFWKNVVLPKLLVKNVLCSNQWKNMKTQQNSTIFIIKISVYIFCYQKNFQVKQLLWNMKLHTKASQSAQFSLVSKVSLIIYHNSTIKRSINLKF